MKEVEAGLRFFCKRSDGCLLLGGRDSGEINFGKLGCAFGSSVGLSPGRRFAGLFLGEAQAQGIVMSHELLDRTAQHVDAQAR